MSRKNSQPAPENRFVPLLYATLTVPPPLRPYSALMLLVTTRNSAIASGDGCITWFENPWLLVPYALLSTPSSRKLLNVLRRPLTVNAPSRPVPALLLIAERRTPVVSCINAEYSRPLSGSATTCSAVTTWLRWLESRSSLTLCALTSTASLRVPIASAKSARARAPIARRMSSMTAGENPSSSPRTW